jgi:uncharacterized protein YlaI
MSARKFRCWICGQLYDAGTEVPLTLAGIEVPIRALLCAACKLLVDEETRRIEQALAALP